MKDFMQMQMQSQTGGVLPSRKTHKTQQLGTRQQAPKQQLDLDALMNAFGNVGVAEKPVAKAASRRNPTRMAAVAKPTRFGQEKQALVLRKTAIVTAQKVKQVVQKINFNGELTRDDLVALRDFIVQQNKRIELKNKYIELIEMAKRYINTGTENPQEEQELDDLINILEGFNFGKKSTKAQEGGASPIFAKIKTYKHSKNIAALDSLKMKIRADTDKLVKTLEEYLPMYIPLRDELVSRGLLSENDELYVFKPKMVTPKRSAAAMEMDGGKRRRGRPSKK